MMLFIRLVLTLALPIFLGYGIVGLIFKNKTKISFLERFALAWGIGIGLLGLEMFTLSLFGISLNLITAATPVLIFIAILLIYLMLNKITIFDLSSIKRFVSALVKMEDKNQARATAEKLLILMIGLTIAYVFFDALVKPIVNFDDLWRQGCIAKIVFSTGKVITDQTLQLAGPHPFLNPLSQAWVYMGIGTWNDAIGKIIFPLCYLSLLLILYANLHKNMSRIYALLFTYLFTSLPLITYHAGTAYSDLMQTFYYSAGVIYLFQWMKQKERPHLYFSALLLGIGNFVKQSGIPLWVIAAVVLFVYIFVEEKKEAKAGGTFILVSVIVSAPWLFYQNSFLMRYLGNIGSQVTGIFSQAAVTGAEVAASSSLPYGPPTIAGIIYNLGRRMLTYADWQILWLVFILAIVFFGKYIWASKLKYLLLMIILDLLMIIYAFHNPVTYQFLVDGTLVNRTVMYQIPLTLFFISLSIGDLFMNKTEADPSGTDKK